jgi:hypothetical protein
MLAVARRHNMAACLQFRWRLELGQGPNQELVPAEPRFAQVALPAPVALAEDDTAGPGVPDNCRIEIVLARGRIIVGKDSDIVSVRQIVAMLGER